MAISMLASFQDYLSAAVQLKTALVKAKPSRQEWEQAPPFFRCTAAAIDSVERARQGGFSIQYSTALQLKDQGNELVSKDPGAALERYTAALSVFLWFNRGPDRAAEDIPLRCAADELQGAEKEQAYHLLAVSFCNAAACLLQLGLPADAAYACSKALKYDPYSVKALYRRAQAVRQANPTTAGLEAGAADLVAANQLEPANNQIRLAMIAVQHELREQRRKERSMYGNMFERGTLYGEQDSGGGQAAALPSSGSGRAGAGAAGVGAAGSGALRGGPHHLSRAGGGEASDDADANAVEDREGAGSGVAERRDPEDLTVMDEAEEDDEADEDFARRKARSAAGRREADQVLRRMRRCLASARSRRLAAFVRQEGQGSGPRRAGTGAGGGLPFPFPWWAVPWWAYALIALHLVYRLVKIWNRPLLAGDVAATPMQPLPGQAAHGEL